MNNATLDAVKAAQDAQAWHELNRDDPQTDKAAELLTKAVKALEDVENFLLSAAECVSNTPEDDRIVSLMRDAEDLEISVRMQIERMK